ncbi:RNI-like protein [Gonapodya prolifera JEL478]|uniref:RNI-like protein n=1 Tax=Gonapodya prolifera (strain JEL478) TaxID=1344416 RepID=A0A139ARE6_GONPJ|nr:RNI-like protein [Gonapodya prolifera JEL478]|eukprot:KXS19320.1 RNI-like protein [Gonapodya prolifera JEL478]
MVVALAIPHRASVAPHARHTRAPPHTHARARNSPVLPTELFLRIIECHLADSPTRTRDLALYAQVDIDCDDGKVAGLARAFDPECHSMRELAVTTQAPCTTLTVLVNKALKGSLAVLCLSECRLGDAGLASIADALSSAKHLRELCLSSNGLTHHSTPLIAAILERTSSLKNLRLYGNELGPRGAHHIARALHTNRTLEGLWIGQNGIGPLGARSLGTALTTGCPTLAVLDVVGNWIGPAGARDLAAGVSGSKALRGVRVSDNAIGDTGAAAFARLLEDQNRGLRYLHVDRNGISAAGVWALRVAADKCEAMETLDVWGNAHEDDEDATSSLH